MCQAHSQHLFAPSWSPLGTVKSLSSPGNVGRGGGQWVAGGGVIHVEPARVSKPVKILADMRGRGRALQGVSGKRTEFLAVHAGGRGVRHAVGLCMAPHIARWTHTNTHTLNPLPCSLVLHHLCAPPHPRASKSPPPLAQSHGISPPTAAKSQQLGRHLRAVQPGHS